MVIVLFVALGLRPTKPSNKKVVKKPTPYAFPCRKCESKVLKIWKCCNEVYVEFISHWLCESNGFFDGLMGVTRLMHLLLYFIPQPNSISAAFLNKKTERIFHSKTRKLWACPLPIASCPNRSWPKSIWKTLGRRVGALTVGSLIPVPLEWEIFSSKTLETSRGWKKISHKKTKEEKYDTKNHGDRWSATIY